MFFSREVLKFLLQSLGTGQAGWSRVLTSWRVRIGRAGTATTPATLLQSRSGLTIRRLWPGNSTVRQAIFHCSLEQPTTRSARFPQPLPLPSPSKFSYVFTATNLPQSNIRETASPCPLGPIQDRGGPRLAQGANLSNPHRIDGRPPSALLTTRPWRRRAWRWMFVVLGTVVACPPCTTDAWSSPLFRRPRWALPDMAPLVLTRS